ncbi:TPA: prephenate dehydrogenase/arogenate dehydrogenase family protein [Candidatus Peregrinibacteria bacterium]|nr:prephenate dehydrogenase/arogenate dehydrogenase family protein [Candidatus Peregrinibacteria bacterium]
MNKNNFSIGIIGGTGIMGKFFESVFLRYGIKTFVWSRKSEESLESFCTTKNIDIIIVSVSIDVTEKIIAEIGTYISDNQCICDVTSVKIGPMNAMQKIGKPYFGMHPMFAPPLSGKMDGQNVIFCSGKNSQKQEAFIKNIFEKDNSHILESTAQEHDEIMSIVQGLSHFFDITFVQTLRARGLNLEKIFASRSPAYALKLMLSGRTLYQDSELYGNIQIQNSQNIKTLETFFTEAQKLFTTIKNKDLNSFNQIFNAQTKFLGKYAKRSQDESDIIIDYLANRILSKKGVENNNYKFDARDMLLKVS